MNKFFQMLKENWIGGILGIIIPIVIPPISHLIGNNIILPIINLLSKETGAQLLLAAIIGYPLFYIIGAFIQSKLKK